MRLANQLKQMTLFHFRTLLRNKIAFFFNLVMPLHFLLVFGAMYGGNRSGGVTAIGLVDHDGGPTAQAEQIEATHRLSAMDFMMPGMRTYMLLNACVVSVAIPVAYHRKNGTMRHMFSTPLSMGVWLAGRILSNVVLAVVQILLIWIVGIAVFKEQPPSNLMGTAVILLFTTLTGMGIGLTIGALAKDGDSAQSIALIITMALSFLGNAMMPLEGAPQIVQTLMGWMPSFYMTHALQQVMMKGKALATVSTDLAILVATAAVCLSMAAWRLRKIFTMMA